MDIYHGSETIVQKPIFGKGKPYNDYGLGFYCTKVPDLAREWSVSLTSNGFINAYELDTSNLSILYLDNHCVLSWLAVLLENRTFSIRTGNASFAKQYIMDHFMIDYSSYDLIQGYRADDSYFSFAQSFLNGAISVETLAKAMKLGFLGTQIVLKSPKAFEAIKFKGYETVDSKTWYPQKKARLDKARRDFLGSQSYNGLFISEIIKQEIGKDDPRLQ